MVSMTAVRQQLKKLLHLDESPHRTALAFAVGTFIAFSPTYGLHTLIVFFCGWAFRLNVIALFAGALINNPWTLVPILAATLWTGFQLLGMPDMPPFPWEKIDAGSLYHYMMPYLLPFAAGGFLLGVLGALISYPVAYVLILHYRKRIQYETPPAQLPHKPS